MKDPTTSNNVWQENVKALTIWDCSVMMSGLTVGYFVHLGKSKVYT